MAINHFIPTIWSENLITALNKQYIAVGNCSRDYEGEIKKRGSVVKICGVGSITVGDYTRNTDMSTPQALSETVKELTIDQAKYFNFQLDDVDKVQCTPKLLDAAINKAAESLADDADKYVYRVASENATQIIEAYELNDENMLNYILQARTMLQKKNVTDLSSVVFEISPQIATMLYRMKLTNATDNTELLETGCIGSIAGCKIYVSNNLVTENTGMYEFHDCIMRTKRAITFAEQLSEIDAYRPEKRFADAVKGLHLYGSDIIYPDELVVIRFALEEGDF